MFHVEHQAVTFRVPVLQLEHRNHLHPVMFHVEHPRPLVPHVPRGTFPERPPVSTPTTSTPPVRFGPTMCHVVDSSDEVLSVP